MTAAELVEIRAVEEVTKDRKAPKKCRETQGPKVSTKKGVK
jgi:hypothetical protein